ncbi:MAG TPA: M20 family metallopeptidase [Aggregatilineales bacterium]|nr:M20 family metallopeptidase [Aggregatilineales bacterium]
MSLQLDDIIKDLVRIPSPNPPGDTRDIAAYIADIMQSARCGVRKVAPVEKPQAESVIATLGEGTPVIMMHAHIDTVPIAADEAAHWSVDPYAAEVRDGKLYGKGSIDDKAPLAAMMYTMLHAARNTGGLAGTLVLVAAAEEETGGQLGTRWMAEKGHLPEADFIIVGEQTQNKVATAHKGVMRATVRTTGKSVHATNPDRGVSAITAMARVVLALEDYHKSLAARAHPVVGVPTCNVGVIQGGSTANAVADSCVVYLDRRMVPGEDPAEVQQEMRAVVEGVDTGAATVTIDSFQTSMWFSSTVDTPLAQTFMQCVEGVLRTSPGPIGYLPGSDAKHLTGLARGEMVIFGPGSYEVAHAYDEYVDLGELAATARILIKFVNETILNG